MAYSKETSKSTDNERSPSMYRLNFEEKETG
jgi:hypothetical protein